MERMEPMLSPAGGADWDLFFGFANFTVFFDFFIFNGILDT